MAGSGDVDQMKLTSSGYIPRFASTRRAQAFTRMLIEPSVLVTTVHWSVPDMASALTSTSCFYDPGYAGHELFVTL
jgi:hypothetical protein